MQERPRSYVAPSGVLPEDITGAVGDSDIVVRIGAASNEDLRETVVNKVQSMEGVVSTETLLVFPKL